MKNLFISNKMLIKLAILIISIIAAALFSLFFGRKQLKNTQSAQPIGSIGETTAVPVLDKSVLYPTVINDQSVIRFLSSLKPEFQDYSIQSGKIVKQYESEELYIAPKNLYWSPDYTKVIINEGFSNGKPLPISLFDFNTRKLSAFSDDIISVTWLKNGSGFYIQTRINDFQSLLHETSQDGKPKVKISEFNLPNQIVTVYPTKSDSKLLFYIYNPVNNKGTLKILDTKTNKLTNISSAEIESPILSNNSELAVARDSNSNDIIIIGLETGKIRNTRLKSSRTVAAWSNDDQKLFIGVPNAKSLESEDEGDSLYQYLLKDGQSKLVIENIDGNKLSINSILPTTNPDIIFIIALDSLFKIQIK